MKERISAKRKLITIRRILPILKIMFGAITAAVLLGQQPSVDYFNKQPKTLFVEELWSNNLEYASIPHLLLDRKATVTDNVGNNTSAFSVSYSFGLPPHVHARSAGEIMRKVKTSVSVGHFQAYDFALPYASPSEPIYKEYRRGNVITRLQMTYAASTNVEWYWITVRGERYEVDQTGAEKFVGRFGFTETTQDGNSLILRTLDEKTASLITVYPRMGQATSIRKSPSDPITWQYQMVEPHHRQARTFQFRPGVMYGMQADPCLVGY